MTRKRERMVLVRLSEAEYADIAEIAGVCNQSLAGWMRETGVARARASKTKVVYTDRPVGLTVQGDTKDCGLWDCPACGCLVTDPGPCENPDCPEAGAMSKKITVDPKAVLGVVTETSVAHGVSLAAPVTPPEETA